MRKFYDTFKEIAEDFTNGESITHNHSKHTVDECIPWQHGVLEFAEFLDRLGLSIVDNLNVNKLWHGMMGEKGKERSEYNLNEPHEEELKIDWDKVWDRFNKWMRSQGCILDVRRWDFQNSQEAKSVIELSIEEQLKQC